MTGVVRKVALGGIAVISVVIVLAMVVLSLSVVAAANGVHAVKKWQLAAATRQFQLAKQLALPFKEMLPNSSLLQLYSQSLDLGLSGLTAGKVVQEQLQKPMTEWSLKPLSEPLSQFHSDADELSLNLVQSPKLLTLLSPNITTFLDLQRDYAAPLITILKHISTGDHRYAIMFLNSNELRPTGGFNGSYALIDIHDGRITSIATEDIYDADGQFEGFLAPPPGVKEYLSGGKGWRLPDSNWWIDYPKSAQQQLKLLALGKRTNVEGVVSVNSDLLKRILTVTGPVYLPDTKQQLTTDSLFDILEKRPGTFFPGSRQKQQVIDGALTQLIIAVEQLPLQKQLQLIQELQQAIHAKEIQAYSEVPLVQESLAQLGVTGAWPTEDPALALVEANVGINKNNRFISRSVALKPAAAPSSSSAEFQPLQLTITWQNTSPSATSSATYLNYQRLVVPEGWRVSNVRLDDRPIEKMTTGSQTYGQTNVTEVGFLVPVFAQTSVVLSAELNVPQGTPKIVLVKQAGVPPTPVTFENQDSTTIVKTWDRNVIIDL